MGRIWDSGSAAALQSGSCLGHGHVIKDDERASRSYPPSLSIAPKGVCTRAAPQSSIPEECPQKESVSELGMPWVSQIHRTGVTMETGTATTWASTLVCLSRAKAPVALGKPHPSVAQPICFSGIRKQDGNETKFLAILPQACLHLRIRCWAYPLLLAERRTCRPSAEAPRPFPNPSQPY